MGFLDELGAKLAALKLSAEARQAALVSGRPARTMTEAELAKGHPKVSAEAGFQSTVYQTRLGSCFGWFWLIFTCAHCVAFFYGLSGGTLKVNGRVVEHAAWWHYLGLAAFYVPFFLVGFAFTLARYRIELTDDQVLVRWRILPYVGWTWVLPVGEKVTVSLAFRGSESNDKPVEAIVVASHGKEIDFGAFLPLDVKEHLAGLIRHYYGEAPATEPFLAPPEPGR